MADKVDRRAEDRCTEMATAGVAELALRSAELASEAAGGSAIASPPPPPPLSFSVASAPVTECEATVSRLARSVCRRKPASDGLRQCCRDRGGDKPGDWMLSAGRSRPPFRDTAAAFWSSPSRSRGRVSGGGAATTLAAATRLAAVAVVESAGASRKLAAGSATMFAVPVGTTNRESSTTRSRKRIQFYRERTTMVRDGGGEEAGRVKNKPAERKPPMFCIPRPLPPHWPVPTIAARTCSTGDRNQLQ